MGHVGLTPQTSTALGGYRAQGRTASAASRIAGEALALQEAGCFALVFEAIPSAVAAELMPLIDIPVIGIGAGPATDGQVLVFHDLLGIREGLGARFVKRYASLQDEMAAGVSAYADDVRTGRYPGPEHGYSIEEPELEAFREAPAPSGAAAPPAPRSPKAARCSTSKPPPKKKPPTPAPADPPPRTPETTSTAARTTPTPTSSPRRTRPEDQDEPEPEPRTHKWRKVRPGRSPR